MPGGIWEVNAVCELFGVCARDEFYANDYLKAFYAHSDFHPHGWGLACVSRNGALVEKESVKASQSHYLLERLSQPITEKLLLAHIRYATIGNVEYKNCHPFTGKDCTGRRWTLIHNGTIFDYPALNPYQKIQKGDTDSERVFLCFLDKLNEATRKNGARLHFEERFLLFDEIICDMSRGNKLNLVFTDGKYLYAHTNCKGTMNYLEKDGAALVSTQPLTGESWQPAPFGQLFAFCKGRLIKSGTEHHHEYIQSEEEMKLIYQIFANL